MEISSLLQKAVDYFQNGKFDLAKKNLKKILKKDNKNFDALHIMGVISGSENNHLVALEFFEKAKKVNSNNSFLYFNLAKALSELGENLKAIEHYKQAINLDSNNVEAWLNCGETFQKLNKFEEAMDCYDKLIKINPNFYLVWSNKGAIFEKLGKYQEAIFCYDQAIKLNPQFAPAWSNKGVSLEKCKKTKEAIKHHNKAIEINPNYYDAYFNKSISKLISQDLKEGWYLYDYRWKTKNTEVYRYNSIPELSSLLHIENKNILVWCEQGFGDTIQFSRFIPLLTSKNIKINFEVQEPLYLFLKNQFNCNVVSKNNIEKENIDFQIPLMSLPRLFETTIDTIPKVNLKADIKKISSWKKKLNLSKNKLNIGIALSGNKEYSRSAFKSIKIDQLHSILSIHNIFIIQKELDENSKSYLKKHPEIMFLGNDIQNFTDTAAITENMDIIITVDTSLIHLAGSLNKKSILMLPFSSEWRWFYERKDSPWYPSIKIFRQKSPNIWDTVINEINLELNKIKNTKGPMVLQ